MSKTLFVCSQGVIRSRTAEVLSLLGGIHSRSSGTDEDALTVLNNSMLLWADKIICMEKEHLEIVQSFMGSEGKSIHVLNIPDEYMPFDELLVGQLIGSLRSKAPELSEAVKKGSEVFFKLGFDKAYMPKNIVFKKSNHGIF